MILPKIILIDDELRIINSHFRELEIEFKDKYEVKSFEDLDSAYKFLTNNYDIIKLVILDVMMPAGELLKDVDTGDGLSTGVHFYEKIRGMFPDLPIIIFTNFSGEEIKDQIEKDKKSKLLRKEDYLPFQLADEIKDIFK